MENYTQDTDQNGIAALSGDSNSPQGDRTSSPPQADPAPEPVSGESRWRLIELDSHQRDEVAAHLDEGLLEKAARTELPFASSDFFDEAEVAEGLLPEAVRAAYTELRWGLCDCVVVRGLPHDETVKDMPGQPSRDGHAPARGHGLVAAAVRRLGHEYSYAKEKGGALVHDIFPTKAGAAKQSNESWQVDLSLHTENAFHPLRPDFVVLYCVRAPSVPPATHLSLLLEILPNLTDEEMLVLREELFTIDVVDSFLTGGEQDATLPLKVLDGASRMPLVRWHQSVKGTDEPSRNAASVFSEEAIAAAQPVRLQPGDLLAFANDRCLHGRDKFDATLDGSDRWLLRSYVRRDLSPLMPFLAPSQPNAIRLDLAARAVA